MSCLTGLPSDDLSNLFGKNFIGNSFVESSSKKVYICQYPVEKVEIGSFADSTPQDVEVAIKVAHDAFKLWSKTFNEHRAELLKKLSDLMLMHKKKLSKIITIEIGKPITESVKEVGECKSLLDWYYGETKRMKGQFFNVSDNKKIIVKYKPHGVVGLISPGALLGAGCTCVYKPCPEAPLTGLVLAILMKEAGFPAGVFNVITASHESVPAIDSILCTHPLVRHISFIGSILTGKILMQQAASTVKRISLELNGNAPAIVFNRANIEKTVESLINVKFRNSGQVYIAPNRIFVQKEIYDDFIKAMICGVSKLRCGHPMEKSTQISCLYDKKGLDKVTYIVDTAINEGAKCAYQGSKSEKCGPLFYPPTVLTECMFDMSIFKCEIFGPVCAIFKFGTEAEVFEHMNNVSHGLAAYIYTSDMDQIFRTVEELQFGLVAVNGHSPSRCNLPFGGHKESGLGNIMGIGSIRSFCDAQTVVLVK